MPRQPKNKGELNDKMIRFCEEYVKDLNGTQAAIRAGYSPKTAQEQSARLLSNVMVASKVKELQERITMKNEITAAMIISELANIAFSSMKSVASWNESGVRFKPSEELTPEEAACISEVSEIVNEFGGTIKIKKHDKVKALELLGKHKGLFKDTLQVEGKLTLEKLIGESLKRGKKE